MIGRIAGIVLHRASDQVLIDVRGVGYIVHLSERSAAEIPPVGQAVALYTELLVREDLLQLFGFPTLMEKEWHRLLTSVQGVGAKVALAVLGTLGADGLSRAIALGDWGAVRKAPGVGPKLAQRVVLELKDKAPAIMAMGAEASTPTQAPDTVIEPDPAPAPTRAAPPPPQRDTAAHQSEALSALANLGYAPAEAASAVAKAADAGAGGSSSDLIRAALRLLAPKD